MYDDAERLSRLFHALADTTRRRIVDELGKRNAQSLFEIYTRCVEPGGQGQSRQGFSRHLAVLEEVGVIEIEWQGTTKLHRLNTAPLARLNRGWLAGFKEE